MVAVETAGFVELARGRWTFVGDALVFATNVGASAIGLCCGPPEAALAIADARLILSWDHTGAGRALELALFTIVFTGVDALFVIALLSCFASFGSFAGAPLVVALAGARSLFTELAYDGHASLHLIGLAGQTAVVKPTDRPVLACALGVAQTLDASFFTAAVCAFGAVFVSPTDAAILLVAFASRAAFVAALFVFDAGHTSASNAVIA